VPGDLSLLSAHMADDERKARMARRGSSMLTAITKSAVKLTDMAGRAKKVVEEKRRRAEFALIASTSEKWNWITDDKEGFVPAKVLKENPDGSMEVEFGVSRSVKTVKKTELGPPIVRLAEIKNHVDGEGCGQAAGEMPLQMLRGQIWCRMFHCGALARTLRYCQALREDHALRRL